MAIVPALILAAVDYFVTRRDPSQIALDFNVAEKDLAATYNRTRAHSWAAKLAAALEDPNHRPDLLLLKRHLACFEQQLDDLMRQFQYARQTCDHVRSLKFIDTALVLKADGLAFRIHQAASRILREIVKAEIRLEKAEKTPPSAEPAAVESPTSEAPSQRERSNQLPPAANPTSTSGRQQSSEKTTPITETKALQAADEQPVVSSQSTNPQSPATDFPDPEEFKLIILRHRHRIKNTPAKDRPELIARLIRQERERKQPAAAA